MEENAMAEKTLIIGGVAGGATTAARLRRRTEDMQIIMFERGEYISYANCGLPYYIGQEIKSRAALLLQTPEAMKAKFNIDVRTQNEVTRILPAEKKVEVKNLRTGETYEESYDKLVLATGSSPLRPPVPGIDAENIFTIWSVSDTDRIKSYIQEKQPKRAAVIGGGFIGLEMAENLRKAGLSVSIIEMLDQVMAPLDKEMANLLHENIRMNDVELVLGDGVQSFRTENGTTVITLKSGRTVDADLVILSIGVRPNSALAKEAGLLLNKKGGISVNEYLETSVPGIYAVGDVIEVDQLVTGEKTMIPLAGPANKEARILADNLAGDHKKYTGSLGTAVAQVFDLNAASVGLNEKQLKAAGKVKGTDYLTALINQKSHAGYYPGATPITLKMIFTKEGSILGAQIVGQDGVDKRIDTLASVIRLKGSIYDLEELELAYAPPFSSAKDPVNMLGFTAENILRGMVSFISCDELDALMADPERKDEYTVLDVTEDAERMVFSIPGSVHIPLGQLRRRMGELDRNRRIIPYCAIGVRSYNAARMLMLSGFASVSVLSGGTSFYKSQKASAGMDAEGDSTGAAGAVRNTASADTDAAAPAEPLPAREMRILDCCGLQCPGPIMKVNKAVAGMQPGEVLRVSATDMGFAADIASWCRRTGNTLIRKERVGKENVVYIGKGINGGTAACSTHADAGSGQIPAAVTAAGQNAPFAQPAAGVPAALPQGKTIIVFSGDLDKALASFIIANGARAMGRPVTMFFTFWGLNILRRPDGPSIKKSLMDRMFGSMMPKGSTKLKLSKMNMGGMGTAMMKKVMKDKNVSSLEELIRSAQESGIRLVACTMSMDIMGIRQEELIDGVELAGVASYLGDAEESNVNLFI